MKARLLIFQYRVFMVLDVLFSSRIKLKAYHKDGSLRSETNFCKQEILEKNKIKLRNQ